MDEQTHNTKPIDQKRDEKTNPTPKKAFVEPKLERHGMLYEAIGQQTPEHSF